LSVSSETAVEDVLQKRLGIRLNRLQREALSLLRHTRRNILVVAPTGTGKSVIGYAALLLHRRGFYLAPYSALMYEKYMELRGMGVRAAVYNRDLKMPISVFLSFDVRILSPFRFLSLIDHLSPRRHGEVVVVDEIHLISDPEVEAAITHAIRKGFRVVGLSATLREEDAAALARWMNAELVMSRERPVPLVHVPARLGTDVVVDGVRVLSRRDPGDRYRASALMATRLWSTRRSVVVWAPTRRLVERIASAAASMLDRSDRHAGLSSSIPRGSGSERLLAYTVARGVFFYHGGLGYASRRTVFNAYKRLGGIMVTSYSLSHGVNMPARYLIISTLRDWRGEWLDASTFHQIAGRSGRPGFDDKGYVITVIASDEEMAYYREILGKVSSLRPRLLEDPYVLVKTALPVYYREGRRGVVDFLSSTLSYHVNPSMGLEEAVETVMEAADYYSGVPRGERAPAMRMGLHPSEHRAITAMMREDYKYAVMDAVDAFFEVEELRGGVPGDWNRVASDLLAYGYLATILGSTPASRAAADFVQYLLDTGAVYAGEAYGWDSEERARLLDYARRFAYGDNPGLEELARRLQPHVIRRLVKTVPQLVTGDAGPDEAPHLLLTALRELYSRRRRVPRDEAVATAEQLYLALTGRRPPRGSVEEVVARLLEGGG